MEERGETGGMADGGSGEVGETGAGEGRKGAAWRGDGSEEDGSLGDAESRREEVEGEEGGRESEEGLADCGRNSGEGEVSATRGGALNGDGAGGTGAEREEERAWRGEGVVEEGVSEERADWKRRMASGEGGGGEEFCPERNSSGRDKGARPEVSGRRSAARERKEESMEMGVSIKSPPCGR